MEKIINIGEKAKQIGIDIPGNAVRVELLWKDTDRLIIQTEKDPREMLKLLVSTSGTNKQLIIYTLVPWQNFSINYEAGSSLPMQLTDMLLTVTDSAVIYASYSDSDLTEKEKGYLKEFDRSFKTLIDYDSCFLEVNDAELDIPEGIQILTIRIFPFYIDLQVALPGSTLPEQSRWGEVSGDRMLRVSLVPDIGEIKILWFKPSLINSKDEEIFGNYTPKITPDTAEDFMPALLEKIHSIPEARLSSLNHLIGLFITYKTRASENPGYWENGNMLLGAREREYIPSEDEILLSETGNRLESLIGSVTKDQIKMELKEKYAELKQLEYVRFTFTHVDVMGSGRFYYIDTMTEVQIALTDYVF